MKYAHLGRSGLSVSRICLGTMNFSWTTEKADAFKVMDSAHDHGINFFDTANRYGRPTPGITESILGDWFAQGGRRREKTVLATKLYGDIGDWPNEGKQTTHKNQHTHKTSLTRLKTDYVDLYQFH